MFIKQTDIDKVVDKWISHPDEVKREDLKKPYLNTYFWVTKPKGKDDYVRVLGNFEIFMDLHSGQKSNSGKSKSPNQTVFFIKDLTTHEETKEGFIIDEYHGSLNSIVAILPITDAEYVIKAKSIKDRILFLSI